LLRLTHLYIKGVFLLGFNTLLFFDGASLKSKVTRAIYPFLFDSKGTGKILKIAAFEHYCEVCTPLPRFTERWSRKSRLQKIRKGGPSVTILLRLKLCPHVIDCFSDIFELILLNARFSRRKAVSRHRWILKRNHRRMILNQPMMNSWIARAISLYPVNHIAGMWYPSRSDSTGERQKSHCMCCRCIHKLALCLVSLNLYLFNVIVYILSTVLSTSRIASSKIYMKSIRCLI
jgi:hypothetical protein